MHPSQPHDSPRLSGVTGITIGAARAARIDIEMPAVRAAWTMASLQLGEKVIVAAVDAQDDVARLEAGPIGRFARTHGGHVRMHVRQHADVADLESAICARSA